MMNINPLFWTDGYKLGHRAMLAPNTTRLYGTWIPRSLKHAPKGVTKVVSFGQQLVWKFINDQFEEHFFSKSVNQIEEFQKDMVEYLGMDYTANHFLELHKLGYLPIRVQSLPEGVETAPNVPHMTFINTVDGFAWLTLYLETLVSALAWKPSTSATIARQFKLAAEKAVAETDGKNIGLVPFMCHDFSARGLNPHDIISSGLGHATAFRGSDSLPVIPAAKYYYGETEVPINSVNASEHSVSTTKIFTVGEQQMINDWLDVFPNGILSVVADTFDLFKFITEFLPANKEKIMSRDGKLTCRPDSGNPVDIICGLNSNIHEINTNAGEDWKIWAAEYAHDMLVTETPHGECGGDIDVKIKFNGKIYNINYSPDWNRYDKQYYFIDNYGSAVDNCTFTEVEITPEQKGVIELLWDIFGGTVNEQGYKVLDPHIGAIYGDSINLERQAEIYRRLEAKGFAATNIVLGVGSYTYQYTTRDTLGFAAKGAWFECEGKGYSIYKDPATDDGTKKSLKGFQFVNENFEVESEVSEEKAYSSSNRLKVIFEDGRFHNQTTLTEIRERLSKSAQHPITN